MAENEAMHSCGQLGGKYGLDAVLFECQALWFLQLETTLLVIFRVLIGWRLALLPSIVIGANLPPVSRCRLSLS